MNYVIEGNFDFFKELNSVDDDNHLDNTCLISHLPLIHNSILLPCSHSFNYLPLYKELCLHNNKTNIRCPYCRSATTTFIPFIPLPGVVKVIGVNSPEKVCMPAPKCSVLMKIGVRKGLACKMNGIVTDHGVFCKKHIHCMKQDTWTEAMEKLMKDKTVVELKQMLKKKGLKVGGVKKELVKRLLAE